MSDELASALDGSRGEEEAMRYFITTQKRATSGIYYFFALLRSRSLLMFLQRRYEFERRFQPAHELLKPTEGWQPASAISCEKLCLPLSLSSTSFFSVRCRGGMDAVANGNNKEREEAGERKYRANNVHEISFVHYCTLNSISFRPLRRDLSFFNWSAF